MIGVRMNKNIETAKRAIIEAKRELELNIDPLFANYILRDLQIVKDAKLDDLSWAMDRNGCCKNDVLGLISYIEKYIRDKKGR